ncbi:hypothetical protein [Paenibacillus swuensis]|uniref:hypothetical protein n=1 Tax=Paenibacillus swuensis TaxID=1178515 RepID=UPI00083834D0|nr:hypothetical protein [Paenibacillus swuensis]
MRQRTKDTLDTSPASHDLWADMQLTSRELVIETGVQYLRDAGTDRICQICIGQGGSCCADCPLLRNGVGCQQRNISCTAWLCGFLKYILFELNLLDAWNDYWIQVPGQDYRKDFTPEFFFMSNSKILSSPDFQQISEAFALDLNDVAEANSAEGYLIKLREKIDKNIECIDIYRDDPAYCRKIHKKILEMTAPFHRFHRALDEYRVDLSLNRE